MKLSLSALLLLALTPLAVAQNTPPDSAPTLIVDVWPEGKMPGQGAKEPEKENPPKGDNVQRLTNVSRPTLAFFPAPKKTAPSPTLIVCPGGAYSILAYNSEGTEIATWLNSKGFNALVLKYRVPNNREGALQDIQRAVSLVRSRATEWNTDPKRLGIIGFSAGGNLAAKASTHFETRSYPKIDAADDASSRPDFVVLVYPAYLDREGKISPDLDLKVNVPPTLILHSDDDSKFVPGSKIYDAALTEAKIAHAFKLYPTGGHGYGLRCKKDARAWPEDALGWLHQIGIH